MLRPLEGMFTTERYPNLLVGLEVSDDAAVYKINDEVAVIQTLDFFTPVVDEPYDFGAISAANSLSDIYAMGGKPLFALNIVAFPSSRLPMEVLQLILRGAHDKAAEAGISLVGGHTIDSTEPVFGLAVTGVIDPKRILSNSNAQPGDAIILTKPIGLGIISTAVKQGLASSAVAQRAIEIMSRLNRPAAEVMTDFEVNACTDVTGFGLLGHLREMSVASGVNAIVFTQSVPVIDGTAELAAEGVVPGGTLANMDYVSGEVIWEPGISRVMQSLLCDAQTSGGLLMAVPSSRKDELLARLAEEGVSDSAHIGNFTEHGDGKITVRQQHSP